MIKHIVMWNLKGETPEERHASALFLKDRFEGLVGLIPGMRRLEVGMDTSRVDYACDVVLYTEFDDQSSLDDYAIHPEHVRVRAQLGEMRVARYQVDYVVQTQPTSTQ